MSKIVTRDESPGSASDVSVQKSPIPRIPLDVRQHKRTLLITAVLLVSFSGVLPVILYYIIKYGADAEDEIAVTVSSVVFGVYSILPLFIRIYKLVKKDSNCRPLGATRRHMDYFQLNFITLFCALTGMIAAGSSLAGSTDPEQHKTALRVVAMSLSILIICVPGQMLVLLTGMTLSPTMTYPFRISSMTKNDRLRPASYTIAEDVVAVDGKQGTEFRRLLNERYLASEDIRALFKWADVAWGFTGVPLAGILIIIIWVVPNVNVGFVLGWIVPWVWASLLTFLTIQRTKAACRSENARYANIKA